MQHKTGLLAISVGAAVLIVCAMALAPTMIGMPGASATNTSHSWVTDAFPTGQAGFARADDRGN